MTKYLHTSILTSCCDYIIRYATTIQTHWCDHKDRWRCRCRCYHRTSIWHYYIKTNAHCMHITAHPYTWINNNEYIYFHLTSSNVCAYSIHFVTSIFVVWLIFLLDFLSSHSSSFSHNTWINIILMVLIIIIYKHTYIYFIRINYIMLWWLFWLLIYSYIFCLFNMFTFLSINIILYVHMNNVGCHRMFIHN